MGYTTTRGDPDEQLYSYGFDEEKSKVLCAGMKQPLPNIFQGTAFKRYVPFLIDAKETEHSSKYFFLSSTTDRKEKINKWVSNVILHLINYLYDDFKNFASQGFDIQKRGIQPQDFDFHIPTIKFDTKECILDIMKHAAELSNNNLVRNSTALMQSKDVKIDKDDFSWINNSLTQAESKFKLGF